MKFRGAYPQLGPQIWVQDQPEPIFKYFQKYSQI